MKKNNDRVVSQPSPLKHGAHHIISSVSLTFFLLVFVILGSTLLPFSRLALAGGGGITTSKDRCILTIDFYDAHFSAYQPTSSGSEEFCQELPDIGETVFVLNYLHSSLSQVPVDFRIIKDITGLGRFARWEDLQNMDRIEDATVFYRPLEVESGGSYRIRFNLPARGDYIGLVRAGHPSNDKIYRAIFPFRVGATNYTYWLLALVAILLILWLVRRAFRSTSDTVE